MTKTALKLAMLAGALTLGAASAEARMHYRHYYYDEPVYNSYDYAPGPQSYGPPSDALGPAAVNGIRLPSQPQGAASGVVATGGQRNGGRNGHANR